MPDDVQISDDSAASLDPVVRRPANPHGAVMSHDEVAEILGCSRQAVHQCEKRAIAKLRKWLSLPNELS